MLKSAMVTLWGNMSDVLLWVLLTGGAAALSSSDDPKDEWEERARRNLVLMTGFMMCLRSMEGDVGMKGNLIRMMQFQRRLEDDSW